MSTTLRKWVQPKTGEVRRIYIERSGLKAKLWLEQTAGSLRIHHHGNEGDFTVSKDNGESIEVCEAREALSEFGLDIGRASWTEIVASAS